MRVALLCSAALVMSTLASAQQPNPDSVCGMTLPRPATPPPPGADPITLAMVMCFGTSNETPVVDPQTYLYYIHFRPVSLLAASGSRYDDAAETTLFDDFRRLWATSFLDDLSIDTLDYTFANGTPGKVVVFRLEERRRVRLVDYEGATRVSRTDIDERLTEHGIALPTGFDFSMRAFSAGQLEPSVSCTPRRAISIRASRRLSETFPITPSWRMSCSRSRKGRGSRSGTLNSRAIAPSPMRRSPVCSRATKLGACCHSSRAAAQQ